MREREREGFAGYGYETAGGDRVTALRDMFDGGGAGRSGDQFEGGGILSLIANLLASPYGSERERTAGIIDQPTRPPRTRPSPPPQAKTAGDQRTFPDYGPPGSKTFPNYGPPGSKTFPNYGPPGSETFPNYGPPGMTASEEMMMGSDPARDIRRLPSEMMMGRDPDRDIRRLQAERVYQQAVDIILDPASPPELKQQAMRVIQSMRGAAAPAEVASPNFGPDARRSTVAEPDFTTRRQALEAMMRNPDMPNMARGAMGVLGDEDRVGIDPRTGRMMFGASIPR